MVINYVHFSHDTCFRIRAGDEACTEVAAQDSHFLFCTVTTYGKEERL